MATRIRRFNERNLPGSKFQLRPHSVAPHGADHDCEDCAASAAAAPIRIAPTIGACPLERRWRLSDLFGSDYRELSREEHRRCMAARRLLPLESRGVLMLNWEAADDDARFQPMTPEESGQADWKFAPASPFHVHAEVVVDGIAVHIDWLHARKFGPGRSYDEVRIFVDRRLGGRGGCCACSLGFGADDLPAVAAIGDDAAITVSLESIPPRVELWSVTDFCENLWP